MVSSKVKVTTGGTLVVDASRASRKLGFRDFKLCSGNEKAKDVGSGHELVGGVSRKDAGKPPTLARKSMPVQTSSRSSTHSLLNVPKASIKCAEKGAGKFDNSVKLKPQRKALADLSNVKNVQSYQLRNQQSSDIALRKYHSIKCLHEPRISLTRNTVVKTTSSKKVLGGKEKDSTEISEKHSISGTRRGSNILRNQSGDGTKLIKRQGGRGSSITGTCSSGRPLYPRPSLASQKVYGGNTSSRKHVKAIRCDMHISSKAKATSVSNSTSTLKNLGAINPPLSKAAEALTSSTCEDTATMNTQESGLEKHQAADTDSCNENVTVIISKPNHNRRRSYTSSLMERYKVVGECTNSTKMAELPSIGDSTNPLEVAEYVDDLYQYYWTMEFQNPLPANYMTHQTHITPRMRAVLINWLIEVHFKFDLMQETLFLMVELLDRTLSVIPVQKDDLQLAGLTVLLLASKYEDFWHPKIKELLSISANIYTRDQMLAMEKLILAKLRFRLNLPTPYVFMLRFLKAAQSERKVEHLSFYLIESCLVEYEALKFKPSLLCASAVYVARCTLLVVPCWSELLRKHARYEESELRECANFILGLQRTASLGRLKTTYEKFSKPDRSCVAMIKAVDKLPLC